MSEPVSAAAPPDDPTPHLADVLLEEQRQCWRRGERLPAEEYLRRHVAPGTDPEVALGLVYNEFVIREECGEAPRPEEYLRRFPQLASQLQALMELHRAFPPAPPPEGQTPTGPGVTPREAPLPWPMLPGYEVLGELGRGGMGVVYQARHLRLNRLVALKVILAGAHASEQDLARFRAEAEAVARLQHPNLVQIYEVGEQDGRPFCALEYVDGGSLARRLGGTPLPPRAAAQMAEVLARAMQHAHERGVVHRDLKPTNVLLAVVGNAPTHPPVATDDWQLTTAPKITDFGLAKLLGDGGADNTRSGALLGTPGYAAPEQVEGRSKEVGPAADVYALGAILYEMLTGRPPFQGPTPLDTLFQVRNQEPVPPSRLQPKVPRDLETICLKCLRKEPEKRYATAAELAEDLQLFLSDRPIRARRTGLAVQATRWCRRNPAVSGLLGSVALLLVTIAVVPSVLAVMLGRQRDEAREHLGRAQRAEAEGGELFDSYLAQVRAVRSGPQVGQRHRSLQALARVSARRPSLELRNEAIAFMTLTDLRKTQEWAIAPAGVLAHDSVFDARLERHAWSDAEGTIIVRSVADDRVINRLQGPGSRAWVLQFSPDGRLLAAKHHPPNRERPNQSRVWDVERGEIILTIPFDVCDKAFAFSPDSRWFAVGGHDEGVRLFDLAGGNQDKDLVRIPRAACLAFDPTGKKLTVAGMGTGDVQVHDVASGALLRKLPHPGRGHALAWQPPDGKRLAVGCADFRVYVWDVAAGGEPLVLRGHEAEVLHVVFSHDGNLLASTGWEGGRLWDAWTGKHLLSGAGAANSQFSLDGRVLGCGGSNILLWEVTASPECRVLHGHTGYKGPWDVDYSPDGRLLVSAGNDGVRIWDAALARQLAFLGGMNARSALVDPAGRQLLVAHGSGLERWPITADPEGAAGGLRVGPAEPLLVPRGPGLENRACLAADGRTLAFGDYGQGQVRVLDLETLKKEVLPEGLGGVARVAISPDGRWVAGVASHKRGVRVWDRSAGVVSRDLPQGGAVAFSPDGEWLVIGTPEGHSFWKVGSWEPGQVIRAEAGLVIPAAFSRDGRVMAVSVNNRSVGLFDPAKGQEIATLTAPDPGILTRLCFSPDSSQLAAATSDHAIQLWDLRLIRRQLATMNLDWDLLPYPPAPEAMGTRPLSVTVLTKTVEP